MNNNAVTSVRAELPDALLNKRELAARVKRSTRWVELRVEDGSIPAIRLGRTILFSWPDVLGALGKFRVN